jgi:hypothetical protein
LGTEVPGSCVGDDLARVASGLEDETDELIETELVWPGDFDDAVQWRR